MPNAVVDQLVDMTIGSDEVDMMPVLAGGRLVTGQSAHPAPVLNLHCLTSGWSTRQLSEIVVMPATTIVVKLVNMKIVSDEDDMLLVIAGGHVAGGPSH